MRPTLQHDADADAIYIRLNDLPYAFGEDIDHARRIDYASDGQPIGIEVLCVSKGIDTHGLPHQDAITRLAEEHSFKVFA
ncbi:MAG: DUF2283 domain-containing protein [Chloroflexota bacterium]|nr:MAG: hypothetical protein DLM70_08725 [Chloroflexota bacterium]